MFVFSCATVTARTRTAGNTTILNGVSAQHPRPCRDVAVLAEHAPLRFALGNDTGALGCPWRVRNSGVRMALCVAALAAAGAGFFLTFFRRTRRTVLVGVLTGLAAAGFAYVLYIDAADVARSHTWCRRGMAGVPWVRAPAAKHCAYGPLVLVPVLDAFTALFWVLLTVCTVAFVCRAGPGRGSVARPRLLPRDNRADDDRDGDDPYPDVGSAADGEADRDAGAVPSAAEQGQPQGRRRGGLLGLFRGGRRQPAPGSEDERGKEMTAESVNFEAESATRFAPMSRTDRKAKNLPLGESSAAGTGAATGNALFNFEDIDSTQGVPQQPQEEQKKQVEQVERAGNTEQAPQQQQQQQQGGMFDFDALAEQQQQQEKRH